MMSKTIKYVEYFFLIFLLFLGLFVSSIGVTFCRYQVTANENVSFKIRGAGEYYIISESDEMKFDNNSQSLNYTFQVSNTNNEQNPVTTNYFSVRLNQTNGILARLYVIDLAGKEIMYNSFYNEDSKEYYFVDQNNNELCFELEGRMKSTYTFRLELFNVTDAILSEIVIMDATYDIEKESKYTYAQHYPLTIKSPYLSTKDNITVLVEDGVKLTLTADMASNAVFTYQTSENVEVFFDKTTLELEPNIENNVTITVSSTSLNDEIVNVTCNIYDKMGHLKDVLTTKLYIKALEVENESEEENFEEDVMLEEVIKPQIYMDYINTDMFDQYSFLSFYLQSHIDAKVNLGNYDFPACTRYSLDDGANWFVLPQTDSIYLSLKENIKQNVLIDLKYINSMEWKDEIYTLPVYFEDEQIQFLNFQKKNNDLMLLEVLESNMGIINMNELSFKVNTSRNDVCMEYLNDGKYEIIEHDLYFNLSLKDNVEYKIKRKDDVKIPGGTYRIKISQKYNDEVVKEVYQYFFVLEE